ncbi:MAG TPA: hypothetical protein VG916_12135 [Gemmatimonadaceae bacterium]|nr:hypothetical protein [Gemmatimonadaceae bacterium]
MFSACIFCNKPLGANESIETFPVGRRLAFDPARGRLWVVCPACERWNLSPLDERWEAIEQAEQLYRDTRRRVSTDNVGLARLRDGTSLVRIGDPLRPEFAAWRYGDQFGRRRRRAMLVAGGGVAVVGALVVGGATAGVSVGSFGYLFSQVGNRVIHGSPNAVVARIRTDDRGVLHVRRRHLGESTIGLDDDGSLALHLRFKHGQATFVGDEAARIASIVVPTVNRFGGNRRDVAEAVDAIESFGSSERFLGGLSHLRIASSFTGAAVPWWRRGEQNTRYRKSGLFALPHTHRLAIEMALHEEAERRAMEGELTALEDAWRDAEEIAAIADSLLVPESVEGAMRRLKDGK